MPEDAALEGEESGKEFRQKLESSLQENKVLRELAAKQYGVTAKDLDGVPVDQFEAKAEQILTERQAAKEAALREGLKDLGWDDEQIEATIAAKNGGGTTNPSPSVAEQMGGLTGQPASVPKVDPSSMTADQKIRYGIEQRKKQARVRT